MSDDHEPEDRIGEFPDSASGDFQYDWPQFDLEELENPAHSLEYLAQPPSISGTASTSPQIQGTTVNRYFEGISSNAILLGISTAALLDASARSPFEALDYDSSDFTHFPPSLRPTQIQCQYQHHPFFDCIPIPSFRDRGILASSSLPPLVNRFDLCYDMFAGGLTWRDDSAVEENWSYSSEFREKWKALIEADLLALQRHVATSREQRALSH